MTQMGIAAGTLDLDPMHAVAEVVEAANGGVTDRLKVARPATAGIELGIRIEQRRITAGAVIDARCLGLVVLARERALGRAEPADLELLVGELFTPGLERFFKLVHRYTSFRVCFRFAATRRAGADAAADEADTDPLSNKADLYLFRGSGRTYDALLLDA